MTIFDEEAAVVMPSISSKKIEIKMLFETKKRGRFGIVHFKF